MKTTLHAIVKKNFDNDTHLVMEKVKPYFKHESMQNINDRK